MKRNHRHFPAGNRRDFLKKSAVLTSGAVLASVDISRMAHAAGAGKIKVGLIGCGGRGTTAAINATNAGPDVQITALADLFPDKLEASLEKLQSRKKEQVSVDKESRFTGFAAYQLLIDSGVDVVLIAPASHFIPMHLHAAVKAARHVFCEKPHGIDVPGVNVCARAAEYAKSQNLSLVSGLCWRYDVGVRETMKRIHDGQIGDIIAIQETYVSSPYFPIERQPGWSELEYQMRNWYHFNWLSGDQTAQQLIHSLDKASWALGDIPPARIWGMGGRQTCTAPKFGDQFDHQSVVFEYPDGKRVFGFTRDQEDCYREVSDYIIGTRGRCDLLKHRIEGEKPWQFEGAKPSMYDVEHKELFDSVRQGKPLNNGRYMCLSSLLAIAAQIACYSGQALTWDQLSQSKRSFALPRYRWDVEPPVQPLPDGAYAAPMQGKAEFAKWQMPG